MTNECLMELLDTNAEIRLRREGKNIVVEVIPEIFGCVAAEHVGFEQCAKLSLKRKAEK